jgi:cytochrome b involved in lipid metabolism
MFRKKVFSKETAVEHVKNNSSKTFIAVHDYLYDVTEFLDKVKKV